MIPQLAPDRESAPRGLPSIRIVFCLGQLGDVERGVAEREQRLALRQIYRIEARSFGVMPSPQPFSFSEKIHQARQLDDVVCRQYRANQIRLRRGVDFVQMMLGFRLRHKPFDALVESAVHDHVGTRAEGGAHALLVD
jgi:hypothetical protein